MRFQVIKITLVSRKKTVAVYWTVIRPIVMYGLKVWTFSKSDENALVVWERKILRKIFGPVKENGV
jgi:hypothetical protein